MVARSATCRRSTSPVCGARWSSPIDEGSGEIIYTIRIAGTAFRPEVLGADAVYNVPVSEPDTRQTLRPTGPTAADGASSVEVVS